MMFTNRDMEVILKGHRDQIAYLQAVCRIAADRLQDGGTFPINGETWQLLDFAAGPKKQPDAASSDQPKEKT